MSSSCCTLISHYISNWQWRNECAEYSADEQWRTRLVVAGSLLHLHMGLLDAVVVRALANVNVSNLCVVAVEDAGNLLESGATEEQVSIGSEW